MTAYLTSSAPHIKASETVPKIYWQVILSLLPAVLAAVLVAGADAVRIFGCSVSAAVLAEIFGKKVFAKKPALEDGASILIGILFSLLCPGHLPNSAVILGSFFSVFFGKEIFGGTGQYVFHPALVGQALVQISYNNFFQSWKISSTETQSTFMGFGGGMLADQFPLAILAGGLYLILKKIIRWEVPLIFILSTAVLTLATGGLVTSSLFLDGSFFAAFYLVADAGLTPMNRAGSRLAAFLSALIVFLLRNILGTFRALPFSLLIANALTPWIDARRGTKK